MAEAQVGAGMFLKRPACIRCRQHKLRCVFNNDSDQQCIRCSRAQVKCRAAPARQVGRPARNEDRDLSSLSRVLRMQPVLLGSSIEESNVAESRKRASGTQASDSLKSAINTAASSATSGTIRHPSKTSSSQPTSQPLDFSNFAITKTGHDHTTDNPDPIFKSQAGLLQNGSSQESGSEEASIPNHPSLQFKPDVPEKIDYIREFSNLNQSLHKQLNLISPPSPALNLHLLTDPNTKGSQMCQPISNMLTSSHTFLDILQRYSKAVRPAQTAHSPPPPPPTKHAPEILDEHSVLLIMSCYARILRIYNIIYFHIYLNYLSDPAHPPLIGLHVNGAAIRSGQLQVMVLTSLVLAGNYSMEKMLQIPGRFRFIEEKEEEGTETRTGLFREENLRGVVGLVAAVSQQEERGEVAEGMGGMGALRKSIKAIKLLMAKSDLGGKRRS